MMTYAEDTEQAPLQMAWSPVKLSYLEELPFGVRLLSSFSSFFARGDLGLRV